MTYTTIPYAPSPMYCKLVYLGPTENCCPRTVSELLSPLATPEGAPEGAGAGAEAAAGGAPSAGNGRIKKQDFMIDLILIQNSRHTHIDGGRHDKSDVALAVGHELGALNVLVAVVLND